MGCLSLFNVLFFLFSLIFFSTVAFVTGQMNEQDTSFGLGVLGYRQGRGCHDDLRIDSIRLTVISSLSNNRLVILLRVYFIESSHLRYPLITPKPFKLPTPALRIAPPEPLPPAPQKKPPCHPSPASGGRLSLI